MGEEIEMIREKREPQESGPRLPPLVPLSLRIKKWGTDGRRERERERERENGNGWERALVSGGVSTQD
jgi:hypothetical protein